MKIFRFEPFELDPEARVLRRHGDLVPIAGKPLDILLVLVQNPGRLVDKDELLVRVWAGVVVEEANLKQAVSTVRKILGDNPTDHRYIATVAGRGYQFVAPVTEVTDGSAPVDTALTTGRYKKLAVALASLALSVVAVTWVALRHRPKPAPEFTQQRVTFNSSVRTVVSAAISPDGKYVAYSDAGGIHVKLLSTGEEQIIATPGDARDGTIAYVDSWFPDGTQLLGHSKQIDGHTSIWTTSVMVHSQRELRRDAAGWQVSPDGTRIAFSPMQPFEDSREIWVTDVEGENTRKILALGENEWLSSVHWSPDGRRLAYIRAQRRLNKYFQWIETCDLTGTNRVTLLAVSDVDPWVQDLAWLRDGEIIYSRLEPSESNDANLWQITVDPKRGTPASVPRRLTNWAGSNLVGLTASADGTRVALRKETKQLQVWLGELSSPGKLKGVPRRLTYDEANDFASAWTADSKAVIFQSDVNGRPNIFRQSISGEGPEPLVIGPKAAILPRLSPDGTWVLYMEMEASAPPGSSRLMRVPVNGGSPQLLLETSSGSGDFQCSRAPASLCLISEMSTNQRSELLTAFDPLRGRGNLCRKIDLLRPGVCFQESMSRDGSTFAIVITGQVAPRIRLLPLAGGSDREIIVNGWPNIKSLDWAPDGKGFYCGSVSPEGASLIYVDLEGTARLVWRDREARWIDSFGIPSPDSHHLAISGRVHNSNVWTIENF